MGWGLVLCCENPEGMQQEWGLGIQCCVLGPLPVQDVIPDGVEARETSPLLSRCYQSDCRGKGESFPVHPTAALPKLQRGTWSRDAGEGRAVPQLPGDPTGTALHHPAQGTGEQPGGRSGGAAQAEAEGAGGQRAAAG